MEESKIFTKIVSEHKWYVGFCSADYASKLKKRYYKGSLKQSTVENMLNHFGYYKTEDSVYEKVLP